MKNIARNNKYSLGLMCFAFSLVILSSCQNESPSEFKGNYPQDGVVRISSQFSDIQTRAEEKNYARNNL